MSTQSLFKRANDLMLNAVQIQRLNRSPSDGGNAVQTECHPAKVMIP
jgi:hypothetical protein